jgi:multisubunit Na+/H+ antiporter MnhF subunit
MMTYSDVSLARTRGRIVRGPDAGARQVGVDLMRPVAICVLWIISENDQTLRDVAPSRSRGVSG